MAESNQTDEKTKTENSEEEYKEKVKVSPVSFTKFRKTNNLLSLQKYSVKS